MSSDALRLIDEKWAAYLGCSYSELTDGKRHVVGYSGSSFGSELPWPATRGPVRLFSLGKGWVLSVPPSMVDAASAMCLHLSLDGITSEGDRLSQDWWDMDSTNPPNPPARPGGEAYGTLHRLMDSVAYRGWSHYVFAYWVGDPDSPPVDHRIVDLDQTALEHIREQWEKWPGPMCRMQFQASFEVCRTFGLVVDGRLASVGQVQAFNKQLFWEYGIDTLSEFRGRGYATTVCTALTSFIAHEGHIPYHYTDQYNRPSRRLPGKLGYIEHGEGIFCHVR